jgi:hypothetical protein
MSELPVKLGMLVRDDFGRQGIVCSRKERPPEGWINEQLHADDIRKLAPSVSWWGVMPLDGGLVLIPEPMMEVLRRASYEDFLAAVEHANVAGRQYLATLFPEYVDRVLADRRAAEKPQTSG